MSTAPLASTQRTRGHRLPERARADRAELYDVLDSEFICHIGFVVDGSPVILPTGYGRDGDFLYLHGSTGARSLMTAASGAEICVTVTHLEDIVLARSVFHHSMNYRSAVIYGVARRLQGEEEKLYGLRAITSNLSPGRWEGARLPTKKELAATTVLELSLAEASVKARQGQAADEDEDYALDYWAGLLPVRRVFGEPVPDPRLRPGIGVPEHVSSRY